MQRAESELQRLQLRYEARDIPYYRVIGEFFDKKLGNFVEKDHICQCNLCGIDFEGAKKKAAEQALQNYHAQMSQQARTSAAEGAGGEPSGEMGDATMTAAVGQGATVAVNAQA